jgi:protein-arginine kinase activator protein McsA
VGVGRKANQVAQLNRLIERAIRKADYEQALVLREQLQKLKHS